VSFIKGIKDLFPTQATAASGKSETLEIIAAIKNLQQDPLAIMQQAKELFESPEPVREPQRDEIDRLDKVLGFAQKLTALRPSNGAAPDAWAAGLDFAREVTPGLMQLLNNFMVLKSQSNGATAPVPGMAAAGATPPASFDPYRDAAALKNHARMMNQQAAAAPGAASSQPVNAPNAAAQTPPPPAAAGTQPPNEIQALLANYGALVLSALNGGQSGAEFAENVARLFGDATPLLIGNHGEAALTEAMLAIPELRLFGQARLQRFAHEFIHWQEILEAEEGEEEVASEANA
jgi:hypothetical protein